MCYPPQDYVGTIPGLHAPTHGVAGVDPVALDASQTNTGRFGLARMPDAAAGNFLEGGGVGLNPVYNALVAGDIPNLDTSKITTGRFGMPRMPDGALGNVLTAQGLGADPAYAAPPAVADTRSRTIVVAASNSIDPTLAPAAYRCDGVADQVEINAAITALGAIGGTVILLEGTYNTTAPITITRNNVTLMGMGWGTIIDVAGTDINGIVVGNGATTYQNIIIQDLRVDGVHVTAVAGSNGIYLWGALGNEIRHVTIQRCWVHNFDDNIHALRTQYSTIAQNLATNAIGSANSAGIYGEYVDYLLIWGNNCYDNNAWGIRMSAANYCRVVENFCYSNTLDDGMYITGMFLIIANNHSYDNTRDGIYLDTVSNSVISGNSCNDNDVNGIRLAGCNRNTVVGNDCWSNDTGDGIAISASSNDNAIVGNASTFNGAYGVDIAAGCARNIVKNNILSNNTTAAIRDSAVDTRLAEVHVDIFDHTTATLGNIGDFMSVVLVDGSDVTIRFNFRVPSDFHELVRARLVVVPLGTGDLRRGVATDFGACGEVYTTHSGSIAAGQVAVTINQLTCLDINAAFTGIAAGDHVGVAFTRYGSDVLDTVNANVHVIMFWMQYV